MTLPGGPGQVNPDAAFGVTGNDGSIPGQEGMDQPTVENILKAKHVRDSPKIQGPLGVIYNGLRAGISMPLAIIEGTVNALSDAGQQVFLTVEHAIAGLGDWADAVRGFINGIGSELNQLLDILRGGIVTPVSEAMQEVKDWWNGVGDQLQEGAENIQDFFDSIWRGFTRSSGSGKSAADVANAAAATSTQADTALQLGEWTSSVQGIRHNSPFVNGMNPTAKANFPAPKRVAGGHPPHAVASPTQVPIAFWLAEEDALRGSAEFDARRATADTNITAFYLDVYRMDAVTATMTFLHSSHDLSPMIGADPNIWSEVDYLMVNANRVAVGHGDVLAFGFRMQGTGSVLIAAEDDTWRPPNPSYHPQHPAALRTGTLVGDLPFASIPYGGTNTPWITVGIVEGDVAPPYFAPRTQSFTEVGTFVYDVHPWANFVDGIYSPGGGGGSGGNVVAGGYGEGGKKGQRIGETLVRGVDFPDVPNATITVTIGNGGAGGDGSGDGDKGGDTYRHAIPGGKAEARAVGGAPGTNNFVGYDQGPARGEPGGTFTWNGTDYAGGDGGRVGVARTGGTGGSPSAGGGGGSGGTYGVSWDGGRGGRGDATFVARQD